MTAEVVAEEKRRQWQRSNRGREEAETTAKEKRVWCWQQRRRECGEGGRGEGEREGEAVAMDKDLISPIDDQVTAGSRPIVGKEAGVIYSSLLSYWLPSYHMSC